ncbi:putative inositol-pentakisphosphate 2-kinase [Apostichopus japonicus]|uniref:Inositol-pentakisphosphate 2-kinase n=1 Tax=Stichopus japonicus TaxID=307972 RepID=A0A2G8K7Q1_STIJA|nr:putative inositol-pentakisphosphate 2-kinase [Apostichopus japonicus]
MDISVYQEANRRDWILCKDYIDNVMLPLLGDMFVTSPKLVKLTPEFVRAVNRDCLDIRPKKRLNAHADSDILVAMVMPDACLLSHPVTGNENPTFCVEIKCKQSFLPPYSLEKSKPNEPVCRFCMLQQLKVKRGSLNHRSKFCPLDIFSGDPGRMRHTLLNLLQTPQNNLKIFKNGSLFFSCHEGNPSTLFDLQSLVQQLQSLDDTENSSPDLKTVEECLQSNAVSVMTEVLTKALLHVDSITDDRTHSTDICAASSYHQNSGYVLPVVLIAWSSVCFLSLGERLQVDGPYPPKYLAMESQSCNKTEDQPVKVPPDVLEGFQKVRNFLVAGTSKDLSIMVTFQKLPSNISSQSKYITVGSLGNQFQHAIKIVDLDPKPSTRIPKYVKLEDEIWQNYRFGER